MVDRERCRQLIWLTWGLLRDGLTSVGGGPEGGGALGQTLGEDRVRVIGQVDGRHRAPAWGNRESAAHTGSHRDTSCSVTVKPFPLPPKHPQQQLFPHHLYNQSEKPEVVSYSHIQPTHWPPCAVCWSVESYKKLAYKVNTHKGTGHRRAGKHHITFPAQVKWII